ncbi:MAG: hypothetical protein R3F62_13305 [Planctomycetota bacterium]
MNVSELVVVLELDRGVVLQVARGRERRREGRGHRGGRGGRGAAALTRAVRLGLGEVGGLALGDQELGGQLALVGLLDRLRQGVQELGVLDPLLDELVGRADLQHVLVELDELQVLEPGLVDRALGALLNDLQQGVELGIDSLGL